MDSMRSLDTSLPGTSPSKPRLSENPEQLLNAFKAAALSVTKLYKTAAADQGRARAEGYQDALDDLLAFLDKEDIGLSDGEGWRIRGWATERLDGRDTVPESDDEAAEKVDGTASPEVQRAASSSRLSPSATVPRTASPVRSQSQAPPTTVNPDTTTNESPSMIPPQGVFTFRSSHSYPQDSDMNLSDLNLSDSVRAQNHDSASASHASGPPITVTRTSRTSTRHPSRTNSRALNPLSRGAGQKRKINMSDFFDISNTGHKDGFGGGGKRGRFI